MERNSFDELVKRFGAGASRRQLLGGLIGSAAALAGVALGGGEAIAAKKGGKGKSKGKGKKHGHKKVAVCHKGEILFVPQPAVNGHLKHGDFLVDDDHPCPYGG